MSNAPREADRLRHESGSILAVIRDHKPLLVLGILLGLGGGAALFALQAPTYQASAKILVVRKRADAVTGAETRHGAEEYVSPAQEVLTSSLIIGDAIRAKKLAALSFLGPQESDPVGVIRKRLWVAPIRAPFAPPDQTNVLKLSFRCGDQEECQQVLTAILDSFTAFINKKYQTASADSIELILREKDLLEKNLATKEAAYRHFREKSPILGRVRDGADLRQERLNSIQGKRSALLLRRVEVEGHLAAVDAAVKAGRTREAAVMLAEFFGKGDVGDPSATRQLALQERLSQLLLEERKLLDSYGPRHPDVLAARNRIEATGRMLLLPPSAWDGLKESVPAGKPSVDPVQAHVQLLKQKLQEIKTAEQSLTKLYETEYEEARRLAAYEIQDESFRGSIALSNQLYETLVKRLGETSLIHRVGGYEVEALEPPLAGRKIAPSALLFLSLGAFVGGFLGLGLAWWADLRDTRFRSRNEVASHLGVDVRGSIPSFRLRGRRRTVAAPALDRRLCTHHNSGSAEAEAFRALRNSLCLTSEGYEQRVIQVTGPCGREGASTVAANLSISLAQAGKKVLLVDANLRAPSLHRLFQLSHGAGLAALIAGAADVAEAVKDSGLPGLAVLPCGPVGSSPGSSPGELLTSQRFRDLLSRMRQSYDFVVVDTPAVLPVTEATAIARGVDVVLLTVHLGKTTRAHAEQAVQILAAADIKVLGVVLNGAEVHRLPSEYVHGTKETWAHERFFGWRSGPANPSTNGGATNGATKV